MNSLASICVAAAVAMAMGGANGPAQAPARLSGTGLWQPGSTDPQAGVLAFSPQYPLWSDGTSKRRWFYLPPGTAIDASNPDAWEFPRGTRLWKEFSYGSRIETRTIERLEDGSWRFAVYVWRDGADDAELAPVTGIRRLPVADAPGGYYRVPSVDDCRACHEGAPVPVLGLSTLQLSPDRDPLAVHQEARQPEHVDLRDLVERGLLRNLAPELLDPAPRIAATSPVARAALGYLHANCGHCHNDAGSLDSLQFVLAQRAAQSAAHDDRVLATTLEQDARRRLPGGAARIVPGNQGASLLTARMRTRNPLTQMPPLGTRVVDEAGLAMVERWIDTELNQAKEQAP